jgi:hypothetical protein
LRRIIIAGAALAVLVGASVALAATSNINTYTAKITFKPSKAGTSKKPVPISFVEDESAANNTAGNRAAPLTNLKTTIYGVRSNGGKFPTCDGNQITIKKSDTFCPKGALVGTGPVQSALGNSTLTGMGSPCNPFLHIWNGGKGKLWFFFTTDATHQCGTLHTGDTAAYEGTVKQQGKNMVTNVPLPPDISNAVAHIPGLYGSLLHQTLTFKKLTKKVKGKKIGFNESFACKNGKRPYSVQYTAATPSGGSETQTIKGSAKCSK